MSGACSTGPERNVSGAAEWLRLAATPTFAAMALATAPGGQPDMLCGAMHASLLGGMAPMYALMAAFHSGPWFRLFAQRRR